MVVTPTVTVPTASLKPSTNEFEASDFAERNNCASPSSSPRASSSTLVSNPFAAAIRRATAAVEGVGSKATT